MWQPGDKIAVVVNPACGSAKAQAMVAKLASRLREHGVEAVLHRTTGAGDAARFVSQAAAICRAVVVVGGDGTVREAVEGLLACPRPMVVVPTGTENLVARQLGYRADVERVWSSLLRPRAWQVDVGLVNGRAFLIVVGAGFDGQVVSRLAQHRRGHITHFSYFWPIWRTFWEYRFPPVRVIADGELICDEPALAFVGNLPRYALGLPILRRGQADDGLLDLCVYRCQWQGQLLTHAWRTMLGRHVRANTVFYRQCRQIEISSPVPLAVQADGDPAGQLPVRVSVLPRAATFLLPRAGSQ